MLNDQQDLLTGEGDLPVTDEIGSYLIETSKWAKFISITFYICTGLAVLFFCYMMFSTEVGPFSRYSVISDYMSVFAIIMVLAVAVIGVTYYFLLAFAKKMRTGIETENIEYVNAGLYNLKVHMIIIGCLLMLGILANLFQLAK